MWKNKIRQNHTGHRWQYNVAHALCVLWSQGCRKTLRMCNNSCFCMAKMDTPMRLHVTFVSTLFVLLTLKLVKEIFDPFWKNRQITVWGEICCGQSCTQNFSLGGRKVVWTCGLYRVNYKSLRDFRPLRYSRRDGHAEGEHVNRGRDTPNFCPAL